VGQINGGSSQLSNDVFIREYREEFEKGHHIPGPRFSIQQFLIDMFLPRKAIF
jgi:hypothetical protein